MKINEEIELRHLFANLFESCSGVSYEPSKKIAKNPITIGKAVNGTVYWTEEGESVLDGFRKREIARLLKNRNSSEILVFPSDPRDYKIKLQDMEMPLGNISESDYYFDRRYCPRPKIVRETEDIPSYAGGPFC